MYNSFVKEVEQYCSNSYIFWKEGFAATADYPTGTNYCRIYLESDEWENYLGDITDTIYNALIDGRNPKTVLKCIKYLHKDIQANTLGVCLRVAKQFYAEYLEHSK